MTFSIKLWVLHHVLIRHKNISDKYHKSLIKKCYGPALKAPSSDQSVRPSACPFEISCPEHIFSPLAQYGSYFTHTVPLSMK